MFHIFLVSLPLPHSYSPSQLLLFSKNFSIYNSAFITFVFRFARKGGGVLTHLAPYVARVWKPGGHTAGARQARVEGRTILPRRPGLGRERGQGEAEETRRAGLRPKARRAAIKKEPQDQHPPLPPPDARPRACAGSGPDPGARLIGCGGAWTRRCACAVPPREPEWCAALRFPSSPPHPQLPVRYARARSSECSRNSITFSTPPLTGRSR